MQLAQMAGWKTVRSEPLKFEPGLAFPEGVVVRPYSSDATAGPNPRNRSEEENRNEVSSNRAADELVAFLNSYNWEASKALGWKQNIPPNTIKVTVGLKPLPYFQPPEIKRVKDQVRQIEQQLRQQEEKH